jgi:acetoin utilization deacetylase AcuC-like enzyme
MTVGLVYDPIYLKHDTGGHVENSGRLVSIMEVLEDSGLPDKLTTFAPRAATFDEVALAHSDSHISRVESYSSRGGGWLDGDTVASPDSYTVALYAAGGVLRGLDAVMAGEVNHAFALVRPPGHHATRDQAMGFCLFNNVAIAAKYAVTNYNLERVLIVDFDVHHGNGTEEIFYSDPGVLYFSAHQYPHYPGTGRVGDDGSGEGKGTTVNVPLPAFCGDDEYRRVHEEVLVPIARRFRPQLILVSAGYDLHWADQLSAMQMTVDGFAGITGIIKGLADELCGGKLLFSLEGGYHLKALAFSIRACLEVLLDIPLSDDSLGKPSSGAPPVNIDAILAQVAATHSLP